jgi:IS5 family transposase
LIKAKALNKAFERLAKRSPRRAIFQKANSLSPFGICFAIACRAIYATLVAAPRQRNTEDEKAAIKEGKTARENWPDKPAKAAQKDTSARCTVNFSKANSKDDGTKQIDIAIPMFGYKNHISIDRKYGIIRRITSDAATYAGARLREGLIDMETPASEIWADTAYHSAATEAYLDKCGRRTRIDHKKPKVRPMPELL